MASPEERRDRLVAVFLVEAMALMIALVTPITPSKTGSQWSAAELIDPDPSYPLEVLVYFVLTNALFGVLGLAVYLYARLGKDDGA